MCGFLSFFFTFRAGHNATPGLLVGSTDLAKSGFILDTVVSTATITNYVKVKKCTAVNTNSQGATGTFQGGETITGGVSGFTGTFRGTGTTSMSLEVADIASGGAISRTSRAAGVDVAGMLRTFGIDNPFGRKQETEADYLGLIFSSLSGYDIRESVKLWKRMAEKNKGKEPPVFMSTHPSSKKRIENLNNWIAEVMIKYPPMKL